MVTRAILWEAREQTELMQKDFNWDLCRLFCVQFVISLHSLFVARGYRTTDPLYIMEQLEAVAVILQVICTSVANLN